MGFRLGLWLWSCLWLWCQMDAHAEVSLGSGLGGSALCKWGSCTGRSWVCSFTHKAYTVTCIIPHRPRRSGMVRCPAPCWVQCGEDPVGKPYPCNRNPDHFPNSNPDRNYNNNNNNNLNRKSNPNPNPSRYLRELLEGVYEQLARPDLPKGQGYRKGL